MYARVFQGLGGTEPADCLSFIKTRRSMRAFFRTLKVAKPWLFMCSLALLYWLRKNTHLRSVDAYEALFAQILEYIQFGVLIVVPLLLLYFVVRVLLGWFASESDSDPALTSRAESPHLDHRTEVSLSATRSSAAIPSRSFRDDPSQFDRRIIRLEGRVEKVFRLKKRDAIRRMVLDWIAQLFGRQVRPSREIHQRFLVSSPQLKKGEWIMVLHNVHGKRLPLKRGMWIQVQGEYLHVTVKKRGWIVKRSNSYGRIHHTQPPNGLIAPIKADPKGIAQRAVEVIEPQESPRSTERREAIERGPKGLPPLRPLEPIPTRSR